MSPPSPNSTHRSETSTKEVTTQILTSQPNKDPSTHSLYLNLWHTAHPSLGRRYRIAPGDVDALSRALDSIYEEQGLLFSSVESRDAVGNVWIGFRGDRDPKSRRYAIIWMRSSEESDIEPERERRLDSKPEITAAGVHNGTLISMGKGTLLVDGPSVLAASLDENEPVPAPDAGAESEVMQAAGAIFNNVRGGSDEMVGEWMLVEMGMDEEDKGWIEL